ncbi:MAG: hypothetical protein AAGC84_20260, partial [Pseudomonas sp.]
MTALVKALFEPFRLGDLELPTRVVMAPMTRSFSPGGVPNAGVIEYYRRRAAAGVGLIVTEGTTVGHKASNGYPHVPRFFGEDALAGWKQVVDAVHAEGGKIVPQLWHVGSVRRIGTEPDASVPGYGPSGKTKDGVEVVHGMTKQDIADVIEAFAQAAPAQKLAARANVALSTDEKQTPFRDAAGYNNFYEFGLDKGDPAENAHTLRTRPWTVRIEGEVNKPLTLDIDSLLKLAPLEERIYR